MIRLVHVEHPTPGRGRGRGLRVKIRVGIETGLGSVDHTLFRDPDILDDPMILSQIWRLCSLLLVRLTVLQLDPLTLVCSMIMPRHTLLGD